MPAKDRYHNNLKNALMSRNYPDRVLYIAVHEDIFTDVFEEEPLGKLILEDYKIPLIVFNPKREVMNTQKFLRNEDLLTSRFLA